MSFHGRLSGCILFCGCSIFSVPLIMEKEGAGNMKGKLNDFIVINCWRKQNAIIL